MKSTVVLLVAVAFLTASCVFATKGGKVTPPSKEVYFVSNGNELKAAIKEQDSLNGLAVSMSFYNGIGENERIEVRLLIQHILGLTLRPVFIYGRSIDTALAARLLDRGHNSASCDPAFFVGAFPTKRKDGSATVVDSCGGGSKSNQEEWFRDFIADYWAGTKTDLKNNGYSVLK